MIDKTEQDIANRDNGRSLPDTYEIFYHSCFKYFKGFLFS